MTHTEHRIIATDWQLKAAEAKRLGAIILPLVPEPKLVDTKDCYVQREKEWRWITPKAHSFWAENGAVSELVLKHLLYQVGDRIYLAEEWCKGDWGTAFDDDIYFTKSTTPEAENIGWQPAETMPPELAQYWYEVTGVKVVKAKNINYATMERTGIYLACPGVDYPGRESAAAWDTTYPDHLWESDRWVVVLSVEATAQ